MRWNKPSVVEICVGLEINGYMPNDELPAEVGRLASRRSRSAANPNRGK